MDILNEITRLTEQLNVSVRKLRETGKAWAEATEKYRIALAEKELELSDGFMAKTLIHDIARGDKKVARAKYDAICAEAIYKANQEAINSIKLQIRVLDNQYAREWGNPDA